MSEALLTTYELATGEQKLVFEFDPLLQGYGYAVYVRNKQEQWQRISDAGNPLVRGLSFDLYPETIAEGEQGELLVAGTRTYVSTGGNAGVYSWHGTIRADKRNGWIRFRLEVHAPEDIGLRMIDGVEPEITIRMGQMPPYDRGDHVWFKTNINNPTKWNDEAYGNDFPAMYYFDAYHQFETMMFFDMTAMNWMNRDNVARFLNYRCGFRRSYKPSPSYELGLYADGFSGKTFPKGKQTFEYYLKARSRVAPPTEQTAMAELVRHCLELVPARAVWPAKATDWQDFAERCADELMDDEQCWGSNEDYDDFILNYVNGYSPAWQEAFAAKQLPIDFKHSPCIDSAAFIGFPLSIVNAVKTDERYGDLLRRLLKFIRAYVERKEDAPVKPGGEVVGTWQYIYILEQLWLVAQLNKDERIDRYVMNEVHNFLIPFSRNVDYLFPLSFNTETMAKHGNGDNYPVGGLYALFMFNLYKKTGSRAYFDEALRGLRPLYQMPINSLSQEVFLLAMGVQAASLIYQETGDEHYRNVYDYLLAQNLRMMYWFDDNTKDEYKDYNIFAMFQACTPIIYPAFFENVEVLARIAVTLDVHAPHVGLLRIFNHARKNNFYLFPECLPDNKHRSNLLHIPFENLGLLEDEKTGWIGQEIYGAGQVFAAYLMWEAFGKSSDRDVMVLNVNDDKRVDPDAVSGMRLAFIVYNPEQESKSFELRIADQVTVRTASCGRAPDSVTTTLETEGNVIRLTLSPDENLYVTVNG
ncbi:hypothetical protein [Cohnella soli]|uniref:Uncharacterized protein n=1 Tax=Cohnella soli TaxID=425005 RepID=A0ABW0HQQ4_9BACL